jgi:hypothetical protein
MIVSFRETLLRPRYAGARSCVVVNRKEVAMVGAASGVGPKPISVAKFDVSGPYMAPIGRFT